MIITVMRAWTRLLGLCVVAVLMVIATQHLALGFEAGPLVRADTITAWIRRPPLEGSAILAGGALTLAGLGGLVGLVWPNPIPTAIATRRDGGWTRVDRRSLAKTVARHLEKVDRFNHITATVKRNGRVDVVVETADVELNETSRQIGASLAELCSTRHLPCEPGRITLTPHRGRKARSRVQ